MSIKVKRCDFIHFFIHFCRHDEVIAAVSLNFDPAVSAVAERLRLGRVITKKEAEYVKAAYLCTFESNFILIMLTEMETKEKTVLYSYLSNLRNTGANLTKDLH